MNLRRIALANVPFPTTPAESVSIVEDAIARAGAEGAEVICFPEAFVPGYRCLGHRIPPPDPAFLEHAWSTIARAAARARVATIVGTERAVDGGLRITVLVVRRGGSIAGWQDKVQLDPSEDGVYAPGQDRAIFESDGLTFGIAICHEGWRYP